MCIRDRIKEVLAEQLVEPTVIKDLNEDGETEVKSDEIEGTDAVSYTHLRAHETVLDLVCRLLLEKKKNKKTDNKKKEKKKTIMTKTTINNDKAHHTSTTIYSVLYNKDMHTVLAYIETR